MPFLERNNQPSQIAPVGIQDVQIAGGATPVARESGNQAVGAQSAFWGSLARTVAQVGDAQLQKAQARAYLEGQQQSLQGKAREEKNFFVREAYTQGFNRAETGSALAKTQLEIQNMVLEHVRNDKPEPEFKKALDEKINAALETAGAKGMDLKSEDWQAWLNSLDKTRDLASSMFTTKTAEKAHEMLLKSVAQEGNAAVVQTLASEENGDAAISGDVLTAHYLRIQKDPGLSTEEKDAATSAFTSNLLVNLKKSDSIMEFMKYVTDNPVFAQLPLEKQTQLMNTAQAEYQKRAVDESGEVFAFAASMGQVNDLKSLTDNYPMEYVTEQYMQAAELRKITPQQAFSLLDAEQTRREKLRVKEHKQSVLMGSPTVADIATNLNQSPDEATSALKVFAATQMGSQSGGGAWLLDRGTKSGDSAMIQAGVDMLGEVSQSLPGIDWKTLPKDKDGNVLLGKDASNALSTISQAYATLVQSGNHRQANQMLSSMPPEVAFGIRQGGDQNSMLEVISARAQAIAAGRIVQYPDTMATALRPTMDDVQAGMFDFGFFSQDARSRNILGVQSWVTASDSDKEMMTGRLNQVYKEMLAEYQRIRDAGEYHGDGEDLKRYLLGRVTGRAMRVDDGTDAATLMFLPPELDDPELRQRLLGSQDTGIIAKGLESFARKAREDYPGARTIELDYNPMLGEFTLHITEADGNLLAPGTTGNIQLGEVRNAVTQTIQSSLLTSKDSTANLAVPGVGFVQYDTRNSFGVPKTRMAFAVQKLMSYEGYNEEKGFSILPKYHGPEYVKQPGENMQQAAQKLSRYVNDKVLPMVQPAMKQYDMLPNVMQDNVFNSLVETTYHAGNPQAFSQYIDRVLSGEPIKQVMDDFTKPGNPKSLFNDAGGAKSSRNASRMRLLRDLGRYRRMYPHSF